MLPGDAANLNRQVSLRNQQKNQHPCFAARRSDLPILVRARSKLLGSIFHCSSSLLDAVSDCDADLEAVVD